MRPWTRGPSGLYDYAQTASDDPSQCALGRVVLRDRRPGSTRTRPGCLNAPLDAWSFGTWAQLAEIEDLDRLNAPLDAWSFGTPLPPREAPHLVSMRPWTRGPSGPSLKVTPAVWPVSMRPWTRGPSGQTDRTSLPTGCLNAPLDAWSFGTPRGPEDPPPSCLNAPLDAWSFGTAHSGPEGSSGHWSQCALGRVVLRDSPRKTPRKSGLNAPLDAWSFGTALSEGSYRLRRLNAPLDAWSFGTVHRRTGRRARFVSMRPWTRGPSGLPVDVSQRLHRSQCALGRVVLRDTRNQARSPRCVVSMRPWTRGPSGPDLRDAKKALMSQCALGRVVLRDPQYCANCGDRVSMRPWTRGPSGLVDHAIVRATERVSMRPWTRGPSGQQKE